MNTKKYIIAVANLELIYVKIYSLGWEVFILNGYILNHVTLSEVFILNGCILNQVTL